MSSRNKRDRERERRSAGDSKNEGGKEDGKESGGKDDSDEANRDEVLDFIRNSTDPKMAVLRAEYEALLHGTHSDFLAACSKLEIGKNLRVKAAETLRDLQTQSVIEQFEAAKKEAQDAFAAEQQQIRETMLGQLLERHKHGDRGWDDSSDTRMPTRKMRRRSDGPDAKMEKQNFQQGTIKRKLGQLSVSLSLKAEEVSKDIGDIQKAIDASAVGYTASAENGKLIFNEAYFEKGDSVVVTHMHLPTSYGTIQNVNNAEVSVKCADGSKTRVYLSQLRTGRCSIAIASENSTSQRSRR